MFEDNEAVIKILLKGRSLALRHFPRVQRVDLDWLYARTREDPGLRMKYINTKKQLADVKLSTDVKAIHLGLINVSIVGVVMYSILCGRVTSIQAKPPLRPDLQLNLAPSNSVGSSMSVIVDHTPLKNSPSLQTWCSQALGNCYKYGSEIEAPHVLCMI